VSTKRKSIVADQSRACDACPWRKSNQGKRTSGGWYTKRNLRRLWAGLRTGEAPGMTCHPTDPDNPPSDAGAQAPEDAQTKECYGSVLLVVRELKVAEGLHAEHQERTAQVYRKVRPKGLTRAGIAHWIFRFAVNAPFLTGGPPLPSTFTEDADIQHPDFDAPEILDGD